MSSNSSEPSRKDEGGSDAPRDVPGAAAGAGAGQRPLEHVAALTGNRDRELLDVTLVTALMDLLHCRCVSACRLVGDAHGQRWQTRAALEAGDLAPLSDPPWLELDELPPAQQHPLRLDCVQRAAVVREAQPHGALTLFPLPGEGGAGGVIEVASAAALGEETERLVASILRIYRNFESLLDYSERDTLTGLLNRKSFDETFLKFVAAPRPAASLPRGDGERRDAEQAARRWLGVVDIDHFKSVNDRFGHLIGDEVLLLVARLLRSTFRFQDRLYRFGGEEFVILLHCADEAEALSAFERLRGNIEGFRFPQVGSVTVSVGFAEARPGDTPALAFQRADEALYHAKQTGRNRVCSHAALLASGALAPPSAPQTGSIDLF
ncbi:GGDEF domain-containing protein [Caldimonas tepidiphila]|uniref:GGDEF domain-containing protein n=1 Tax=Caldimonas tepidiphila TaxID=2315841 RepID=UPI001F0B9ADC|nr:GGDEF domain-containing protein [Caldimonas tepidiphila]